MEPSRKKREPRSVFDVLASKEKKWWREESLNLKPKFRIRHPWMTAIGACVAVVVLLLGIERLFVRAEISDFSPASCLGTWQSPEHAQGSPESLASDMGINASDSAEFSGTSGQIFCGTFVPPATDESGNIKSVGLTLVWNITGLPIVPTSTPETVSTSTASAPSASSSSTASSTSAVTATTTKKVATSSAFKYNFSPFAFFIQSAHAQDASGTTVATAPAPVPAPPTPTPPPPTPAPTPAPSSTPLPPPAPAPTPSSTPAPAPAPTPSSTPTSAPSSTPAPAPSSTPAPVPAPAPNPTSTATSTSPAPAPAPSAPAASSTHVTHPTTTIILGPPLSTPLTPIATTTASLPASTTPDLVPPPPAPPAPDENFLLISYSVDGNFWIPLQKVNPTNWQNLTLSIPISAWQGLKKLQIKVEGIPTSLAQAPHILLDGMFMEVHYDVPPAFAQSGDNGSDPSSEAHVIQVNSNVTIEIPEVTPAPFVPAPNIVSIDVSSDTVSANVQYVGDFYDGNPLYIFMYPHGTTAERNSSDSAYTFGEQPTGGGVVNPLLLNGSQLDPTTKQATVILVAPTSDGYRAATSAMLPGTYDVDISYFDSNTWHLIAPTTFTWQ